MPKRISKIAHEYAGRPHKVGEAFECDPCHVNLLLALGWIEPEADDPGYQTRDMSAQKPRQYRRKAMQ